MMAQRAFSREGTWMFPPTVEELVSADHPARFVGAFVDELGASGWRELGVAPEGEDEGAPAYDPRVLLGVWLYGFMTGVRSARKLEAACRDQVPYWWLTGCQRPDHNTLWRFYERHRQGMRGLLKRTVRTAVRLGLVDLAVQAVDGTKVGGNAAKDRTYDRAGLERLLERTEGAIADLEAQNRTGGEEAVRRLPRALARAEGLRTRVREALSRVQAEETVGSVNLTDGDARWMKSRQGMVMGYNAQAVVSALEVTGAGRTGLLITAAAVVTEANDSGQLTPMVEAAAAQTGEAAGVTVADAGYHSGAELARCADRKVVVVMPESQEGQVTEPYHKEQFAYDATSDTYTCPAGQVLRFRGIKRRGEREATRAYRGSGEVCRGCAAFGTCTRERRQGRTLEVGPHEERLRAHRAFMATEEAQAVYGKRKELVEPTFGILKEEQRARRFLLRGLENVRAEWALLATAFNLRTLYRVWRGAGERRVHLAGATG